MHHTVIILSILIQNVEICCTMWGHTTLIYHAWEKWVLISQCCDHVIKFEKAVNSLLAGKCMYAKRLWFETCIKSCEKRYLNYIKSISWYQYHKPILISKAINIIPKGCQREMKSFRISAHFIPNYFGYSIVYTNI